MALSYCLYFAQLLCTILKCVEKIDKLTFFVKIDQFISSCFESSGSKFFRKLRIFSFLNSLSSSARPDLVIAFRRLYRGRKREPTFIKEFIVLNTNWQKFACIFFQKSIGSWILKLQWNLFLSYCNAYWWSSIRIEIPILKFQLNLRNRNLNLLITQWKLSC